MLSGIDDRALVYYQNSIRPQDCRWAVRNHDQRPSLAKEFQSLKQSGGRRSIEGAGDLIDNQNSWLLQESARQRQSLLFSAGKPAARVALMVRRGPSVAFEALGPTA